MWISHRQVRKRNTASHDMTPEPIDSIKTAGITTIVQGNGVLLGQAIAKRPRILLAQHQFDTNTWILLNPRKQSCVCVSQVCCMLLKVLFLSVSHAYVLSKTTTIESQKMCLSKIRDTKNHWFFRNTMGFFTAISCDTIVVKTNRRIMLLVVYSIVSHQISSLCLFLFVPSICCRQWISYL